MSIYITWWRRRKCFYFSYKGRTRGKVGGGLLGVDEGGGLEVVCKIEPKEAVCTIEPETTGGRILQAVKLESWIVQLKGQAGKR
jgi:hypothetical protein